MRKNPLLTNENGTVGIILRLLEEQGRYQKDLCRYLGISENSIAYWKGGINRSYTRHIDKIAEYFGVTPDFLLCVQSDRYNSNVLTEREMDLIRLFRNLSYENKSIY